MGALVIAVLSLLTMAGSAVAQDATPQSGTPNVAGAGDETVFDRLYPVAIYTGTCTEGITEMNWDLGLTNLVGADNDTPLGQVPGSSVMEADVTIDTNLSDLFSTVRAIVVLDPDDPDIVVACGDFGGYTDQNRFGVTLVEVDNSGINGAAILDEDEGAIFGLLENQVKVTVYLVRINSIDWPANAS